MKKKSPPSKVKNILKNAVKDNPPSLQNGTLEGAFFGGEPWYAEQLSKSDTLFKNLRWYLVSNFRPLLSQMYAEYGIVQTLIDVPVDDALRGGIDIKTKELDESDLELLESTMEHHEDLVVMGNTMRWNRLFGGAGTIIMTDQDPSEPFKISDLKKGDEVQFRAADLWELFWDLINTFDDGHSLGYQGQVDQLPVNAYFNYYGIQLHSSRVMTKKGIQAPSFIRPRLRGWGMSEIETLVRSLNQHLKANDLIFEVLDEFKVDIFAIDNLTSALFAKDGNERVHRRLQLVNKQKNYKTAVVIDSKDKYEKSELTFQGISETMQGIRMQIACDVRMPLTKLFGISAQGFSSGEDDIENYNAMVESRIRNKCRFDILKMVKIRCQTLFGFVPSDLAITFKPLRILSSEQEENVKTQKFNRLAAARQAGEISSKTYKEACNHDNLLPIQVDVNEETLPPPGAVPEADGGSVGGKSVTEAPVAKNSLDGIAQIATVGLVSGEYVLTGKRKDNGLWTFPGGHMDAGETPIQGAMRELLEEAGIEIPEKSFKSLGSETFESHRAKGKKFTVHPFVAKSAMHMPRTILDPDQEISEWKWVLIDPKTEELKPESRHAKKDVIVEYLLKGKK